MGVAPYKEADMSHLANKTMNLSGTVYKKGSPIPDKVWGAIPSSRQGSLVRTKLVVEVDSLPITGDPCPHCGEGPFSRLAQHISLKHPEVFGSTENLVQEQIEDETSEEEE